MPLLIDLLPDWLLATLHPLACLTLFLALAIGNWNHLYIPCGFRSLRPALLLAGWMTTPALFGLPVLACYTPIAALLLATWIAMLASLLLLGGVAHKNVLDLGVAVWAGEWRE